MQWNGLHKTVTAHRPPTKGEIKFGYGCIHYRDFDISWWLKPDNTIKQWIKANDGLRYYR